MLTSITTAAITARRTLAILAAACSLALLATGVASAATINGGYGNDVLVGGPDAVQDVLYCGPGWDVAYVRPGDLVSLCEVIRWS